MKSTLKLLPILLLSVYLISCSKNTDETTDFLDTNHRVGIWVNSEREDTLQFLDHSNLIRKGKAYTYEKYRYQIEGETLFLGLPESSNATQHAILTPDRNRVVLDNMYISNGFGDNSETFLKQE